MSIQFTAKALEVCGVLPSTILLLLLRLLVAKDQQMIGSFGPQVAPHEVTFPRNGWEEAPSGMLSRGSYTAKSQVFCLWLHCVIRVIIISGQ